MKLWVYIYILYNLTFNKEKYDKSRNCSEDL